MNRYIHKILVVLSLLAALPAHAGVRAFACEPEWGALLQTLGANEVSVFTATTALQDPHHIQARPSLIAHMRRADLLVCTGAELEIGWLPVLLRKSGNRALQPGRPGYFMAADQVRRLEVPKRLSRAEGDIHPGGNPHVQTDPRRILRVAEALTRRLQVIDPDHAADYARRGQAFAGRWRAAIERWEAAAADLRGMPVVVHHDQWVYLEEWLGLQEVGELEPKPGIPPTPGHLAELKQQLHDRPARLILRAAYIDARPADWLSQQTGIPVAVLPFTVGGATGADDLFGLFDTTLARLHGALR